MSERIDSLVEKVAQGAKRADADVFVRGTTRAAKCYRAGDTICVDLGPDKDLLKWGVKLNDVSCPNCSSWDVWSSSDRDDPEEVIGVETVRCRDCGSITDYYEAYKHARVD